MCIVGTAVSSGSFIRYTVKLKYCYKLKLDSKNLWQCPNSLDRNHFAAFLRLGLIIFRVCIRPCMGRVPGAYVPTYAWRAEDNFGWPVLRCHPLSPYLPLPFFPPRLLFLCLCSCLVSLYLPLCSVPQWPRTRQVSYADCLCLLSGQTRSRCWCALLFMRFSGSNSSHAYKVGFLET